MLNREEELRFCKARRAAIELDFHNLNAEQRRAVLATDTQWPGQRLFLQKGNVVIYLSYSGNQDLTSRPDLLEELTSFRN